jgi:hypothetical protein
VAAPSGTVTRIEVEVEEETVAAVPLKLTVGVEDPKFTPVIVTLEPVLPTDGVNDVTSGLALAVVDVTATLSMLIFG